MKNYIQDLLQFLNANPTPWHVIDWARSLLSSHGFKELKESEEWVIKPGEKYFTIRFGRVLSAFIVPKQKISSLQIAGSHIDSPCFKLKPHAEFTKDNLAMLGLEIYGAPLITSWLNRDLGIAGKVLYNDANNQAHEKVISLENITVVIPQLAIHLDRQVNEKGALVDKQEQLAAILSCFTDSSKEQKKESHLFELLIKKQLKARKILASDLRLYPLESARLIGLHNEMISSYRIDSLVCVFALLMAITKQKAHPHSLSMISLWDHEEIGSGSEYGAGSPFLLHLIERLTDALRINRQHYHQLLASSSFLSLDLTHATHPGYTDKHEPRHPIQMQGGVVIKHNAQYKYAGDPSMTAKIVHLCDKYKIPYQHFVNRGDMPTGSTIGPIIAERTGMRTIDIGIPQLSMHSARELMCTEDNLSLYKLVKAYL